MAFMAVERRSRALDGLTRPLAAPGKDACLARVGQRPQLVQHRAVQRSLQRSDGAGGWPAIDHPVVDREVHIDPPSGAIGP